MFKSLSIFIAVSVCFACNSSNEIESNEEQPKQETSVQSATLEDFADSLVRLDKYAADNIEKAANYFQTLVPADSVLADSAAVMFLNFAWTIIDTTNQKLWKDGPDLMDLVYSGGKAPSEEQKKIQQDFKKNHLNLQGNGEGDVITVLDYDWVMNILQPKTSGATDVYLSLLAAEETEPTLRDAELTIEMKELVSRIILSEKLMEQKLPVNFANKLAWYNKFYIETICLGSDNFPSLDNEAKMILNPEFKQGYDYLLATYPSSKAAQKINDWLGIVKTKNRKKFEQMRQAQYQ
jgi:hypothetical protein